MATTILCSLADRDAGYLGNMAHVLFANILPDNRPWSVKFLRNTGVIDCSTRVDAPYGKVGYLQLSIRFEMDENTDLTAVAINSSRIHSCKSWSGQVYKAMLEELTPHYTKEWRKYLKDRSINVTF